jgi:hypothetical protein
LAVACGFKGHEKCDIPALDDQRFVLQHRLPQDATTRLCYEVMAGLSRVDVRVKRSATSRRWMTSGLFYTHRLPQDAAIRLFYEVMAWLLRVDLMMRDSAAFRAVGQRTGFVLLRNNGSAVAAASDNADKQCDIPALDGQPTYEYIFGQVR